MKVKYTKNDNYKFLYIDTKDGSYFYDIEDDVYVDDNSPFEVSYPEECRDLTLLETIAYEKEIKNLIEFYLEYEK